MIHVHVGSFFVEVESKDTSFDITEVNGKFYVQMEMHDEDTSAYRTDTMTREQVKKLRNALTMILGE